MSSISRRGFMASAALCPLAGAYALTSTPARGADVIEDDSALHLPAQIIPAPTSISPEAQAFLINAAKRIAASSKTPSAGGHDTVSQAAAAVKFLQPAAARFEGEFKTVEMSGGAKMYRAIPAKRAGRLAEAAYLDIHGGGFVAGGGEMCQLLAKIRAHEFGVEVLSIDYRLLPQHPFPAPLDDCLSGYRETLKLYKPSMIGVGGSSAGGNLAAALLLRARDAGLPMPAALVLQTPGLDMTRSGDSYTTNRYLDTTLYGGAEAGAPVYGSGEDLKNPYVSPIFGNFSSVWPPTLLTSGTRDLLLSDTVRMHRALRRAGVRTDLLLTEAGPHGGFMGQAPEDHEVIAECRRFLYVAWNAGSAK